MDEVEIQFNLSYKTNIFVTDSQIKESLNVYCETLSKEKIQNFASKMSTSSSSDLIFSVNLNGFVLLNQF